MTKNGQVYSLYVGKTAEESLADLGSSRLGLSLDRAAAQLSIFGRNSLRSKRIRWTEILLRQFKSPFIYLLIGAAVLAAILGEFIDASMIVVFVLINAGLGFFQEYRSEQALKTLGRYTAKTARVIRGGTESSVPVDQLVPGDLIRLIPGDIVPADLRLVETSDLLLDESVLTGESQSIMKSEAKIEIEKADLYQAANIAFSSTSVISGQGTGLVVATGNQTYLGSVAKLTVETHQQSSFEKGMGRFSQFVLRLVGITLAAVFFANLMIKGNATSVGDLIIFSIALATAVIPEALPLVTTFSLSRGAMNLAKHKVVVKRLSAIEDMGGIQVLCTDKTGTITENKLTVVEIFGDKNRVLEFANLCISQQQRQKDPFDLALETALDHPLNNSIDYLWENPFDPVRKRNGVVVKRNDQRLLIVRGAAEAIVPHLKTKPEATFPEWMLSQEEMGRRIIVIGHKADVKEKNYSVQDEESDLILTGAIAFADPLKKSTLSAVKKAQRLGVTIKIITGDSPVVAGVVAHEIGLVTNPTQVITAADFFKLSHSKQLAAAEKYNVFARFSPDEKHQLIDVLQHKFEVGFLGEGINDAPALKSANVGLVVEGASDIAREAADIILLNKSLSVIIDGIEEGRQVFANTIKYVKVTLASNFGNFYAVAIASLIIDFLPMLPIQILLVNLLSDFPLIAIATDSVDADEIRSPEGYNLREFALIATIIGLVSTVFDFVYFGLFYRISPEVLQTNWFIGSILTELALLYSLRSKLPFFQAKFPPPTIIVLTFLAAIATVVIPYLPWGQAIFRFTPPSLTHLTIILEVAGLYFVSTEIVKGFYYRYISPQSRI